MLPMTCFVLKQLLVTTKGGMAPTRLDTRTCHTFIIPKIFEMFVDLSHRIETESGDTVSKY